MHLPTTPLLPAPAASAAAKLHSLKLMHACRSPRSPPDLAFLDDFCRCSCSRTMMTTRTCRRRRRRRRQQLQAGLGGPWLPSCTRSQSPRMGATTLTLQNPHETAPCKLAFQRQKQHQDASGCNTLSQLRLQQPTAIHVTLRGTCKWQGRYGCTCIKTAAVGMMCAS